MSRDLLSAISSRLESRLQAADARTQTAAELLKANVALSQHAPFTLLEEPKKPATTLPTTVDADAPSAPDIVQEDASQIDLMVKAQVMANAAPAPAPIISPAPTIVENVLGEVMVDTGVALESIEPPAEIEPTPAETPVAAGNVSEASRANESVPEIVASAPSVADAVSEAASSSSSAPVFIPNWTPPVPVEFGVGATFHIKGLNYGPPMTVTRTGDGVVFAMYTDSEGTREVAFHPNQLDLFTAAP